jgi:hypothetical protein
VREDGLTLLLSSVGPSFVAVVVGCCWAYDSFFAASVRRLAAQCGRLPKSLGLDPPHKCPKVTLFKNQDQDPEDIHGELAFAISCPLMNDCGLPSAIQNQECLFLTLANMTKQSDHVRQEIWD